MLIRIVRMEFEPSKVQEFISIFNRSKLKIRAMEGCISLELLRDTDKESVYYTYSVWKSVDYLNKYRETAVFKETWSETKVLFSGAPMAFSMNSLERL